MFLIIISVCLSITFALPLSKDFARLSLKNGEIPHNLLPFLNLTAVEDRIEKNNGSLEFIIPESGEEDADSLSINRVRNDGKKTIIGISEQASEQLFQKWIDQATSGLMSAVVAKKINERKLTRIDKKEHNRCTNEAKTISQHARCVIRVLEKIENRKRRFLRYKRLKIGRNPRWKRSLLDQLDDSKRVIKKQRNYELLLKNERRSPFSLIAKHLTSMVREHKHRETHASKKWSTVLREIKEETERLKKKKRSREEMRAKFSKYTNAMRDIGIDPKIALSKIGMDSLIADVTNTSELTENEKSIRKPMMMIREGVKLGMMLAGKNVSNFDERKISLISPQFMSVLPDEKSNDTVSLLSPSVLALHDEGSELERNLSLSRALQFFSDTGHEDWMDFVFEASGVTEAVQRMREKEQREEMNAWRKQFTNDNGQPMYFTRENVSEIYGEYEATKIDTMSALHSSMSAQQMHDMNSTGYAVMTPEQIQRFYGPGSPYNNSVAVRSFRDLRRHDYPGIIEDNIRRLAREEMAFRVSRKKDAIALTPVFFSPLVLVPETVSNTFIVLSPLVFSPLILSPSALGPLILSPWIFTPLILSPRVLGPIILSPTIFSPIILSPLALSPLILSPAVAVPLILSPFVLTPFILTPVVMVPLILNPFCLSPFLGVPNTLSPFILSPFVLSPFVFAPPVVNAFVLSPYALSPIVLSDGFLFTAVLSPSWLSSV